MKRKRDNIEPLAIRGDEEFFRAYGINPTKLSKMRSDGLPCYQDDKSYLYFPNEVEAWIKSHWAIQNIKI